jgi:hypothetical protein
VVFPGFRDESVGGSVRSYGKVYYEIGSSTGSELHGWTSGTKRKPFLEIPAAFLLGKIFQVQHAHIEHLHTPETDFHHHHTPILLSSILHIRRSNIEDDKETKCECAFLLRFRFFE